MKLVSPWAYFENIRSGRYVSDKNTTDLRRGYEGLKINVPLNPCNNIPTVQLKHISEPSINT